MKHYDYIIAGAGCAGLSLAYYLSQTPLRNKSILLIDKSSKKENDRTWCFWENKTNPFQAIVKHEWKVVDFYGNNFSATLDLKDYRYKMIRGIDFYSFVKETLCQYPSIEWLSGDITSIENIPGGAKVTVNDNSYMTSWVFNSLYDFENHTRKKGYHYLLQHFKGWEIETKEPVFSPGRATLMDFRIEQHKQARFFYILPLHPQKALVEFTVFSDRILPPENYDNELKQYINRYLNISDFTICHQEFGVIPMYDEPFPSYTSPHIIHIGTAGGQTKPSTGYTFLRTQQHTQALVQAILRNGNPVIDKKKLSRFKLYDSMLLNIMAKNRYSTKNIFTLLFKRNDPTIILKFLDEETNIGEELAIFSTTPYVPFLKAMADVLWNKKKPFQ